MVHGPDDDPLGPATYVKEVYGVKMNPPLSQDEMGSLIATIGVAIREYVDAVVSAGDKMRKAIPAEADKKALAENLLAKLLDQHQKTSGQTLMIFKGDKKPEEEKKVVVKKLTAEEKHRELASGYGFDKSNYITRNDYNRFALVKVFEDRVNQRRRLNGSKVGVVLRVRDIETRCESLPYLNGRTEQVIPTLIDDGWMLSEIDGDLCIAPYKSHPAWGKS